MENEPGTNKPSVRAQRTIALRASGAAGILSAATVYVLHLNGVLATLGGIQLWLFLPPFITFLFSVWGVNRLKREALERSHPINLFSHSLIIWLLAGVLLGGFDLLFFRVLAPEFELQANQNAIRSYREQIQRRSEPEFKADRLKRILEHEKQIEHLRENPTTVSQILLNRLGIMGALGFFVSVVLAILLRPMVDRKPDPNRPDSPALRLWKRLGGQKE